MLHDPAEKELFPILPDDAIDQLRPYGTESALEDGAVLFTEGDLHYSLWIILEGQVRITKKVGAEETVLAVHGPGAFAGEISMLAGAPPIATGRCVGPARLLQIPIPVLRQITAQESPLTTLILNALAGRTHDVDMQLQRREKLAALGKLSAGLAHELNNPAAAGHRAATQLGESIQKTDMLALGLSGVPVDRLLDLQRSAAEQAATTPHLDGLAESDREDRIATWLEEHDVADAWDIAPALADSGLDTDWLDTAFDSIAADKHGAVIAWLAARREVDGLLVAVEQSTGRISELIKAIKDYSYMDQAPQQTIDIHGGIESTLVILGHKLRSGVTLVRDYDRSLPRIEAYGSELNQVWTNILDNALDALDGKGQITISTRREDDGIGIEIADTGPGIPPDVQTHIFEPFFTTKGVGVGTGLGLDIARRIVVVRHKGDMSFYSEPGNTRFHIWLPAQQK